LSEIGCDALQLFEPVHLVRLDLIRLERFRRAWTNFFLFLDSYNDTCREVQSALFFWTTAGPFGMQTVSATKGSIMEMPGADTPPITYVQRSAYTLARVSAEPQTSHLTSGLEVPHGTLTQLLRNLDDLQFEEQKKTAVYDTKDEHCDDEQQHRGQRVLRAPRAARSPDTARSRGAAPLPRRSPWRLLLGRLEVGVVGIHLLAVVVQVGLVALAGIRASTLQRTHAARMRLDSSSSVPIQPTIVTQGHAKVSGWALTGWWPRWRCRSSRSSCTVA